MRKERRTWILRRLVLGLAVAAFVAPAAQARVDESGTATGGSSVSQGTQASGATVVIHGDDKVIGTTGGASTAVIHGDDKVLSPRGAGFIVGDDKVIVPKPGAYTLAGYRRALPQDYPAARVTAVRSPSPFDWGDALVGAVGALALAVAGGLVLLSVRHRPGPAAA